MIEESTSRPRAGEADSEERVIIIIRPKDSHQLHRVWVPCVATISEVKEALQGETGIPAASQVLSRKLYKVEQ
ncbi:hypothetical protein WJX75_002739 [Coccomyxa subellipsoidea]|uniref:Ubiquitin-like domain-containing protein n=1 Tax=Coccomyxa subellipsoidea TaxID=248742 RepID=A0ABR2YXQ0_9CHLO